MLSMFLNPCISSLWFGNIDKLKLLQDGPAYIRVFVSILRDILKEETLEYVLALIDEMLTGKCRKKSSLL